MATTVCTLKRCQGKRGCICPKGRAPIGSYSGRKLEPLEYTAIFEGDKSGIEPAVSATIPEPAKQNSPKKLSPIVANRSPLKSKSAGTLAKVDVQQPTPPVILPPVSVTPSIVPDGPSGEVIIRYNHYKKSFPVTKGSTTSALIDAEYFLSFAFPKSKIHLTIYGPSDFTFEEKGLKSRPWLNESPEGTYHGINLTQEYWVDIEEDQEERKAYEERQDALAQESAVKRLQDEERGEDDCPLIKTKTESCSCIEGNPCLDRYACKDWENRYDVAKRCGWKGFQ